MDKEKREKIGRYNELADGDTRELLMENSELVSEYIDLLREEKDELISRARDCDEAKRELGIYEESIIMLCLFAGNCCAGIANGSFIDKCIMFVVYSFVFYGIFMLAKYVVEMLTEKQSNTLIIALLIVGCVLLYFNITFLSIVTFLFSILLRAQNSIIGE